MSTHNSYWILASVTMLLFVGVLYWWYVTQKLRYWQKLGVMQIPPLPFIGNFYDALTFKLSIGEMLKQFYEKAKGQPYVGFYLLDTAYLLLRDPEIIKHVLVKDAHIFQDRHSNPDQNDRLAAAQLFMVKNPAWKIVRHKVTPSLTSGKLKNMFKLFLEVDRHLDKYLESKNVGSTPTTIEVKNMCADYITDMVGNGMFGLKTNSLEAGDSLVRKSVVGIFRYNFFRGISIMTIFFLPHIVKLIAANFYGKKRSYFLGNMFREVYKQRLESGGNRNDFIDFLVELQKKHGHEEEIGGFKFQGDDLVAQAVFFYVAAVETNSSSTAFALYELAKWQDMQDKLRKDILEAIEQSGGEITYEMVTSLPYLDMIFQETLRLHATLPFLERVASCDYKLPNTGLVLEKGSVVYVSTHGLHYDAEHFSDPTKFDPERFSAENQQKRHKYTYLPFGAGHHVCIGFRLTHVITKLLLVQLIRRYKFTLSEKTSVPMEIDSQTITKTVQGGMYLNIEKISNDTN